MNLQGLFFLANSDNVKRNMDIQYVAIFYQVRFCTQINIFHVLPLSLVKVLQTNKYISHFVKLNSEVLSKN